MARRLLPAVPLLLAAVLAAPAVPAAATPTYLPATGRLTMATGQFQPYSPGATAITYAPDLVPPGSGATVLATGHTGATGVLLLVHGLRPNRQYGAHVHTRSCGPAAADSGPHYQDRKDPVQPSTDPAYANPHNEVWLDFTTDATGTAAAATATGWQFRFGGANSVVVHETHTHTGPDHAGTAGDRLACLDTDF